MSSKTNDLDTEDTFFDELFLYAITDRPWGLRTGSIPQNFFCSNFDLCKRAANKR